MSSYHRQEAVRTSSVRAANDDHVGGGARGDRSAVVLSVVVQLARLLAQHEVDRRHAANDNGGDVPAA